MKYSILLSILLVVPAMQGLAQSESVCGATSPACMDSCARFNKADARFGACEDVCRRATSDGARCPDTRANPTHKQPPHRAYAKKGDALRERELNGKMAKAIQQSDLKEIRRLIEMNKGLDPTYVYDFEFDPQTRQYEGRAVKLRLNELLRDASPARRDSEGLDKALELFLELGMDVTATLAPAGSSAPATDARTAWGPSLVFMQRAKDRTSRVRAFELALSKGLQPNADVNEWLFAELPQVCGTDRSQFAIEIVDLLVQHLGTSLQDDFWRMGERGPETLADVLDRMMSPGTIPRSNFERTQFAAMDSAWENCSPLSRRVNRYLTEGK